MGIVVNERFEVFFDTSENTRKVHNLRRNPKIAFTISGTVDGDERTVQFEGVGGEPSDAELNRLKALYFEVFPDGRGRQSWPGIVYLRAQPTWIRFSDFDRNPPEIVEFNRDQVEGSKFLQHNWLLTHSKRASAASAVSHSSSLRSAESVTVAGLTITPNAYSGRAIV